ncbi:calpain-B-like [Ornithodoros turicata]|uniref:calpain-B-like n=1 Tax=Ornithodoros turicata TaxID=34597 RepID=UPI003138B5F3
MSTHVKEEKIYAYGERGSGTKTKSGKPQYFEKVLQKCLDEKKLFEDPEFPCDDTSIGDEANKGKIVWKRPKDIVKKPRFFVDGVSREDVRQGSLGDCWFVAALASLTQRRALFDRVVPQGQSFKEGKYAGVFHFVFWKANRWVDVVVDDRLPVLRSGEIYSIKSGEKSEFWSTLAEKAYAKLNGTYGNLEGGTGTEALTDFTGGIPEQFILLPLPKNIWRAIKRAFERRSILTSSFVTPPQQEEEGETTEVKVADGLYANHEYSVTGVAEFKLDNSDDLTQLIRLRNPWGESEYTGPWSDVSAEWKKVSPAKREELGVTVKDDGEFWMGVDVFLKRFMMVDMCHLKPGIVEKDPEAKRWETATFEGSWLTGVSAGGSDISDDMFPTNPQYLVTLREPDDEDEDGECSVLISLRQNTERKRLGQWKEIGFAVFEVDDPDSRPKPLPSDYLRDNTSVVVVKPKPSRDVTKRLRLLPATYCILPYLKEPDTDGEFLLRIFTEQKSDCRECDGGKVCAAKPQDPNEPNVDDESEDEEEEDELPQYVIELANEVMGDRTTFDPATLQALYKKIYEKEGLLLEFPLDVCRTMVALKDRSFTGDLDPEEFASLFSFVQKCQEVYQKYDKTRIGSLSTYQLRNALCLAGCYVNLHVLKALVLRYGQDNKIGFLDFIACAVKVSCMEEVYLENVCEDGNVIFSLNEWMKVTMYC